MYKLYDTHKPLCVYNKILFCLIKVVGSERLEEEDRGTQISRFLEGYRQGNTIKKKLKGPSFMGFINSLITVNSIYLIVFIVAVLMLVQHFGGQSGDNSHARGEHLD